jgi:hypothetical protein
VIVVDNFGAKLPEYIKKEFKKFAIKHQREFIDFWNNGNNYNKTQHIAWLESIKPLTNAEKKAARKLTLTYK